MNQTGSCACGNVRYRVTGEPMRVAVCHCKKCQRRTGSAFSVAAIFPRESVEVSEGTMKTFERSSDSGNWVRLQFCPDCGTTVMWDLQIIPGGVGVAGGTFDDTDWLDPKLHVWTKQAHKWMSLPDDAEVLEESNLGKK